MANILIAYSTVDGHTRTICEVLADTLTACDNRVQLVPISELDTATLTRCDKVVIGASIRYGNYRPELLALVSGQAKRLNNKPGAFFTVNLVARKRGRDLPETNPYVKKLLRATAWRPHAIAVFAGKLDYPRYGALDRMIIRLIMWLTDGPTDPATVRDFTDWRKVRAFAEEISSLGTPVTNRQSVLKF